uniref:Synaptophysin-like 2a n=1 Tax=Neogobius melanostomus TaxID=47308 RepID=A0A8C6UPV7_9GOBI
MDTAQKLVSGFKLDLGPLKEPIGFIRVIQWIFAIFVFATTGGYTGTTSLTVECPDSVSKDVIAVFGYPFRLSVYPYTIPSCDQATSPEMYLQGDFSSSAEFFVCVGVFAFLYATATLILYLGFQNVYRQTSRAPIIDLLVTASFAFLWLVSSSAWGKVLTDIKWATSPEHLLETCAPCKANEGPYMGRLNASVIFGFLNLILWAGNCWFIYKETPFHKNPVPSTPSAEANEGPAAYSLP